MVAVVLARRVGHHIFDQGHYQSRMSLANGYLVINVAAVGPFFEVDTPVNGDDITGWPLYDRRQTFATIAGFYDEQLTTNGTDFPWLNQYGGESVISGLRLQVGSEVLNASVDSGQISNFSSTLDIKAAMMTWNYTWKPTSGLAIQVSYAMLVHKLYVNRAAVQLRVTALQDVNASVIDVLNGDCAVRTDFADKNFEPVAPFIWSMPRQSHVTKRKVLLLAAGVLGANASLIDNCPGYKASYVRHSAGNLLADSILASNACNVYGTDLPDLRLSVEYQTSRFRFQYKRTQEVMAADLY